MTRVTRPSSGTSARDTASGALAPLLLTRRIAVTGDAAPPLFTRCIVMGAVAPLLLTRRMLTGDAAPPLLTRRMVTGDAAPPLLTRRVPNGVSPAMLPSAWKSGDDGDAGATPAPWWRLGDGVASDGASASGDAPRPSATAFADVTKTHRAEMRPCAASGKTACRCASAAATCRRGCSVRCSHAVGTSLQPCSPLSLSRERASTGPF